MNGIEAVSEIFGTRENLVQFFADLSKPNKENAVPRGRVANVFLVILAEGELVIRHEGGEDVTLATLDGEKYPMILHEKLVSAWRREMLEQLRHDYDHHKDEINKIRGKNDEWHCSLRPAVSAKKEGKGGKEEKEERIGGLCRECPNCMIFGYAVGEGEDYNVKSRIEGDVYLSTLPEKRSVVIRTFNAVDEVTHTTFIQTEGARTGALFRLSLIRVGTPFVGKIAMKDLSPAEFVLSLYTLVNTTRLGGIKSDFGKVRIIIPAIALCDHEVSSGYEIFEKVKGIDNVSEIVRKINDHVKAFEKEGCKVFTSEDFSIKIKEVVSKNNHDIIKEAWISGLNFKRSIEEFIRSGRP
ncbi:MAG: type I-D CRISPR-associated protein Cas7/Csc2 [Sulfolobales archaeon]|nr:type I-D CRISPR-associated protein Cas7/Csc2 [Sulfolobales archaeon]